MNNFLENGTIMPHGLLSCNPSDFLRGLNKSYNNTALRFGVIRQIYSVNDIHNVSKLSTEYDVEILEQDMNRSIAPVTYKNCLSVDSLGSIADFFEKNFRVQTESTNLQLPLTKGQNGATVLVLCLDATAGKGVVVGALNHPDRPTRIISNEPQLYWMYNGVSAQILPDGSLTIAFNGATDNQGNPTDSSQGTTTWQIKTDGSYEFQNDAVDILADKGSGNLNITVKQDCNLTTTGDIVAMCDKLTVTASGDATVTSSGTTTVEGSTINLGKNASDAAILGDSFKKIFDMHMHPTALGPSGPPIVPLPPTTLSKKVKVE